jgi:hypothetical protein
LGKGGLEIPKPHTPKQRMQRVLGAVLSAPCWVDLMADTVVLYFLEKNTPLFEKERSFLDKKRVF